MACLENITHGIQSSKLPMDDGDQKLCEPFAVEQDYPVGLNPSANYAGVPRRYAEMKPQELKECTHGSILKIGQELHSRITREVSQREQLTVQRAVEEAKQKAEIEKIAALEKLKRHAELDLEKTIKLVQNQYEQKLKEQKLEVTAEMKRKSELELENANEEALERWEAAVKRTKEETLKSLNAEIEKARAEERKSAENQIAELKAGLQTRIEEEKKKALIEKEASMAKLRHILNQEKDAAVMASKIQAQQMAAAELAVIVTNQAQKMIEHEEEIKRLKEVVASKEAAILDIEDKRRMVLVELNAARLQIQHLVHDKFSGDIPPEQTAFMVDLRGLPSFTPDVTHLNDGTDL